MTLNYWMMVKRYPNLKEEVGGSIPGCEISYVLDGKLAKWLVASCALAMAYRFSVSKNRKGGSQRHTAKICVTCYLEYVCNFFKDFRSSIGRQSTTT
jgi:hypothetical protein